MPKILPYPVANNPYSLGDAMNWKRRILKERTKRQATNISPVSVTSARAYGLGDAIDWQRCCLRERAKRQNSSNLI